MKIKELKHRSAQPAGHWGRLLVQHIRSSSSSPFSGVTCSHYIWSACVGMCGHARVLLNVFVGLHDMTCSRPVFTFPSVRSVTLKRDFVFSLRGGSGSTSLQCERTGQSLLLRRFADSPAQWGLFLTSAEEHALIGFSFWSADKDDYEPSFRLLLPNISGCDVE